MRSFLALVAILALTSSCGIARRNHTSTLVVSVDSLSKPVNLANHTVFIVGDNQSEGREKSLLEAEYEDYIKNLLAIRGATVTTDQREADYFLSYDYFFDISESIDLRSYAIPTFTPGQTYTISSFGSPTATVTSNGTWGVQTGVQAKKVVKSYRAIRLFLFSKKGDRLSEVYIKSSGRDTNKRRLFPILLSAGTEFLGTHVKETQTFSISSNSDIVQRISSGNTRMTADDSINYGTPSGSVLKRKDYCSPIDKITNNCKQN